MKGSSVLIICLVTSFCAFFVDCSKDSDSPTAAKPKPVVYELLATDEDGIDIDIDAGRSVEITTVDSVSTNPDGPVEDCDLWTGPDGIPDCHYVTEEMMCRGLPFMALIGTCGADSFLVGTAFDSTFSSACTLTLIVNDWVFTDNDGKFTISVLLK